jgi:nucleotide-binding universal stress UspA family protein
VVDRREAEMRGPIVVGADGSDTSRLAIEEAASIAKGSGQMVAVVFVRHFPFTGLGVLGSAGLSAVVVQNALDAAQSLAEAQSIAILDLAHVRWRFEVRTGEPAGELMGLATELEAEMIVVAGRRHGAIGGFTCGSVSMHLLHRWPGSLLVIHPPSDETSRMPADIVVREG